jgi:Transposase
LLKDKSNSPPTSSHKTHRPRWLYREQLRDILDRRQFNIVSAMLAQWCTNVMRSKVEPMKQVATLIRPHFRWHRRLDQITPDQREVRFGNVVAVEKMSPGPRRNIVAAATKFQTLSCAFLPAAGGVQNSLSLGSW